MGQCLSFLILIWKQCLAWWSRNDWVKNEEPLVRYVPGGYCAVSIGDRIGVRARYRVLRKLGWGGRSTVWLVECKISGSLFALKILTGSATIQTGERDLELFHRIRDAKIDDPGGQHLLQLHDHFLVESPNGRHLCLVLDLVAPNVASFSIHWAGRRLPEEFSRIVVRQCALATAALHRCGVVHTDIKPINVSLVLPPYVDKWALLLGVKDRKSITQTSPTGIKVTRFCTKRVTYPVPSISDQLSARVWRDLHVKLTDLHSGHILNQGVTRKIPVRSSALRAPEVCLDGPWGCPVDVWALGCLTYELCIGQSLFPIGTDSYSIPYLHVLQFGPYPDSILARGRNSPFTDQRLLQTTLARRTEFRVSLETTVKKAGGAPPDRRNFLDFLTSALTLDQVDRPMADELLKHPWLQPLR
ncbi:kinase-like protein, partial [Peniophora sp. CONT]